jgi:hypothetical protein
MKNRLLLQFSVFALLAAVVAIGGCKYTTTDPGYVALAEIRFLDYHQVQPIQIYMYPQNSTSADSLTKTPTAMTYGIVTPYFTNLPTNRTVGEKYHLVAKIPGGTKTIVADTFITLMPNDKKSWLISGDSGIYSGTIIDDSPPANQNQNLAYFRFLNINADFPSLSMIVGDPISGMPLATNVAYRTASPYVGIQTSADTTVTFYVVGPTGAVLGRIAGVGLAAGTHHTLTWGGATDRIPDPTTGLLTLNDTVRIRIIDDDQLGTDLTVTPPLTFRYNIINALVPPNGGAPGFIDYTVSGGLSIVINNNTAYDYTKVDTFQPVPWHGNMTSDGVFEAVPATIPLVTINYIKMVRPFPGAKSPSTLDSILFRLYTNSKVIVSDEIYSIIVFDTVKRAVPKTTDYDYAAPYDSAYGTLTLPIPDVPIANSARIVLAYVLADPVKPLSKTSNNSAKLYVNGVQDTKSFTASKLGAVTKTADTSIVVPAGQLVTFKATVSTDPDYSTSFTPDPGGIYEVLLVGQRGRGADAAKYGPRWMIVKVNPK